MHIVVTGAAGFIGSNLVRALNARGQTNIIAVDNLEKSDKFVNLADAEIVDYLDQDEFMVRLGNGELDDELTAVLHQGACSDTMETDGRFMLRNNYRYSVDLLTHCQDNDVPFLYASSASVYGGGREFREERECEAPLNIYGYSKFLFDQYVRRMLPDRNAQIAGFRYFNVYGPREKHKGRMASVALHFFEQYRAGTSVQVFEGSDGFGAGEQQRDFVAVEDVVKVNLDFLDHPSARAFSTSAQASERHSMRSPSRRSMRVARPTGNRPPRCGTSCEAARSSTRRFRPSSSDAIRASRRPISRSFAQRGTRTRSRRWKTASHATSKV